MYKLKERNVLVCYPYDPNKILFYWDRSVVELVASVFNDSRLDYLHQRRKIDTKAKGTFNVSDYFQHKYWVDFRSFLVLNEQRMINAYNTKLFVTEEEYMEKVMTDKYGRMGFSKKEIPAESVNAV